MCLNIQQQLSSNISAIAANCYKTSISNHFVQFNLKKKLKLKDKYMSGNYVLCMFKSRKLIFFKDYFDQIANFTQRCPLFLSTNQLFFSHLH